MISHGIQSIYFSNVELTGLNSIEYLALAEYCSSQLTGDSTLKRRMLLSRRRTRTLSFPIIPNGVRQQQVGLNPIRICRCLVFDLYEMNKLTL
jgi:hypothetical protein